MTAASASCRGAVAAAVVCAYLALAFAADAQPRTGTVRGRVSLAGRPPGNPVIRMGMDPKCAEINRGRQVIQEEALVDASGSVANVFVRLDGRFPATPAPTSPVVIDQRACVYGPRVVGVRVGQPLQIRNSDPLLHNVHSSSATGNGFNAAEPAAGAAFDFTPKSPEVMLKLGCDVHRWMLAYVGVMPHPYFAVTSAEGTYTIASVPPGTYAIRTWHERFGEATKTVTVRAGSTVTIDFTYG